MAKQIIFKNRTFSLLLLFFSLSLCAQESPSSDNMDVFTSEHVDTMPEFPDGVSALRTIVFKNYRIPKATKNGVFKIYVSFVIEKDGSMTGMKVTNDTDKDLAAEAIRVLQSVKQKWVAAVKNGNPVRYAYVFPITINIQ